LNGAFPLKFFVKEDHDLEALGFDFRHIIAYLINFVILLVLLRAFAYKPIMEMLQKRKQAIADGLDEANKVKAEAEQERVKLQEEIEKARMSSQEEASKIAQATAGMRETILEEARKEAEEIKAKARTDVEAEREAMQAEMRRQLADLTVQLTQKMVRHSVDDAAHRELIGQFLTELGE